MGSVALVGQILAFVNDLVNLEALADCGQGLGRELLSRAARLVLWTRVCVCQPLGRVTERSLLGDLTSASEGFAVLKGVFCKRVCGRFGTGHSWSLLLE